MAHQEGGATEIIFTISMTAGIAAVVCIGLVFLGIALGKIEV